jgi:hypothetical protein
MLTPQLVDGITRSNWFTHAWAPYLLVDTDLRIRGVNAAFEQATGHAGTSLVGEQLFVAFPDNPGDPAADGVAKLSGSLEHVFSRGTAHWMGVQRYDVRDHDAPGTFVQKLWAPMNSPVRDGGQTVAALHHVEDVTAVAGLVGRAGDGIVLPARALWRRFPALPFGAVLGVLAHSHVVVAEALGACDDERAQAMAAVRLEVLATRPARRAGVDLADQAVALWLTLSSCRAVVDDEEAAAITEVMNGLELIASFEDVLSPADRDALLEHLRGADAIAQAIHRRVHDSPDGGLPR